MTKLTNTRDVTEVAVGIIIRFDQAVLLAQRPTGKPYAGFWEFPGGKLEPSESVASALKRELREELGIEIGTSRAWQVIEHDYPHAYVRLHLCIVQEWTGEPAGLEGQKLHWLSNYREAPSVEPLLEATVTILEMLKSFELTN